MNANFCNFTENYFAADLYQACYNNAPRDINFSSVVFT